MSLFNEYTLKKCVSRYQGNRKAIKIDFYNLFPVMPQSTLAEANEKKVWKIYKDFAIYTQIWIAVCYYLLLIITQKRYGLVPSFHSISNSIGQELFKKAKIQDFNNQPTGPVVIPEKGSVEQFTLW